MEATQLTKPSKSRNEQESTTSQLLPVTPVGILAEKIQRLRSKMVEDGASDSTLAELAECGKLASGLDKYVSLCTTPESSSLEKLSMETAKEDWSSKFSDGATVHELEREMLSGHAEGQLLKFLIGMTKSRSVLEIGMFTGYSALAMAEQLLENDAENNLYDQNGNPVRVVACELDPYTANFAKARFDQSPAGSLIDVRIGPAIDTLLQLADGGDQFDFVFIDADKTGYLDYYKTLLDNDLLTKRAIICVDNTLLQGQTYATGDPSPNGRAVAAFNAFVAGDSRVEQVLLPIRDGVTLIRFASENMSEAKS